MNRSTGTCCMLGVAFFLFGLDSAQAFEWEITRVDEREGFMHSESLAVGPNGKLYVSYVLANSPGSTAGVYVATRNDGAWSRTLVSGSFAGYGTRLSVNPATGLPGVVFQSNAGGGRTRLEFWEYNGVEWVRQDVPLAPNQCDAVLAYSLGGEAYIAYTLGTTVAGEPLYFARVARRTVNGWEDVPVPVQGDWLNLAVAGDTIVAVGSSITRGLPGLRWLDAMRLLPGNLAADTVDHLPSEAVDGEICARIPGLAIGKENDIVLAYCTVYTVDSENFAELKMARFHGASWSSPEVLLGGGSVSDPAAYALGLLFRQQLTLTSTDSGRPFVFGVAEDFGSVNVAYQRAGMWNVETIDACDSCSGLWRGGASGIDPETSAPIVVYSRGSQFRVDTVVHVARLVPPTGDSDGDGDVDLIDFGSFAGCLNGANQLPNAYPGIDECLNAFDFNLDGDVDLQDFLEFQTAFSGS